MRLLLKQRWEVRRARSWSEGLLVPSPRRSINGAQNVSLMRNAISHQHCETFEQILMHRQRPLRQATGDTVLLLAQPRIVRAWVQRKPTANAGLLTPHQILFVDENDRFVG
ncbi:hypothetical protein CBOM_07726 [Ceraceosorus bombacis]|uniref:Uncharacterized protein n=1 Tax=Ceraceosorus bombacis TaxID=401625 RepID=A0A0N7LA32_9BASI|nr:hypothetical protein CBOM_07726 [Ceraceosorus bombacis]